jgi:aminoglycoside phosphotransferase (APT) family kinase protein
VSELIDTGWDSRAWIVDGVWLDREPRRPEVVERLRAEVRLLGWLGPLLPLPVPEPAIVRSDPLRVRHRLLVGDPIGRDTVEAGPALGRFLRTLHDLPTVDAVRHGAVDAEASRTELEAVVGRMRAEVLPLLDPRETQAGAALLERSATSQPTVTLVHGDLGPAHILVADGTVSGVIDWTDAHVGDPALDLAWLLNGTAPTVASAVAEAYGVDPDLRRRARDWHRLGPWHEVLYGFDTGQDDYVASGLSGVRARLAA